MNYRDFVSDVRMHGHIDTVEGAERAVRATLETLGEFGGRVETVASGLPLEIGQFLEGPAAGVGGPGTSEKMASARERRGAPNVVQLRRDLDRGRPREQHEVARAMTGHEEQEATAAFEPTKECFVDRVKMREGGDLSRTEAENHVRAVFRALALALDPRQLKGLEEDVPEVRDLWPDAGQGHRGLD